MPEMRLGPEGRGILRSINPFYESFMAHDHVRLEAIRFQYEKRRFPTLIAIAILYIPFALMAYYFFTDRMLVGMYFYGSPIGPFLWMSLLASPTVPGLYYMGVLRRGLWEAQDPMRVNFSKQQLVAGFLFMGSLFYLGLFLSVYFLFILMDRAFKYPIHPHLNISQGN